MKFVINRCYVGFGVSEKFLKDTGVEYDGYEDVEYNYDIDWMVAE